MDNNKDYRWISVDFNREWKLWHMKDKPEIWVLEHINCIGAIAHDLSVHECTACKKQLSNNDLTTVLMIVKKDKLRM